MIYPTINDLSKGEYNRYEIALATAKCARMITNEYVRQRKEAEQANAGTKEGEKPMVAMIDKEMRDEKAVKIAIGRIYHGDYTIIHKDPAEQEKEERAILEGMMQPQETYFFSADLSDEGDDEADDEEDDIREDNEDDQAYEDDQEYEDEEI